MVGPREPGGPSSMRDAVPQVTQLKDYTPPAFRISRIALDVNVEPGEVTIRSTLQITRNADAGARGPLVLDGESLDLVSVSLDGRALGPAEYKADVMHLTIADVP